MKRNKTIFITTGNVDGIGLEIARKALEKISPQKNECFVVLRGKSKSADAEMRKIKSIRISRMGEIDLPHGQIYDLPQKTSPLQWFEDAIKICLKNPTTHGIATGPMAKIIHKSYGPDPIGHTEVIAKLSGHRIFPVFLGQKFHVILATSHLPLRLVPQNLTPEKMEIAIKYALQLRFLLPSSKRDLPVALVGINPHAGENGFLGKEETLWKKIAKKHGPSVEGPLVPDVAYRLENWNKYSVYISPYHDQGLIPFKMAHGFHAGTQLSFGAPFIRTSVDHGTAKDLYGKNLADPGSMLDSLQWCRRLIGK